MKKKTLMPSIFNGYLDSTNKHEDIRYALITHLIS